MKSKIASMWTKLEQTTVANLDASAIRSFISLATTVQGRCNRDQGSLNARRFCPETMAIYCLPRNV